MADRLVQQHAGPAGAEHDGHATGRCGYRFEVYECLAHRLARKRVRAPVRKQLAITVTSAATGRTRFAPAALFGDHLDVHAHERAHVGGERAVHRRDEHGVEGRRQAHDHLAHARIERAHEPVDFAQRGDLVLIRQAVDRIDGRVQRTGVACGQRVRMTVAARLRDRARAARGRKEFGQHDLVGIREAGLLAAHRAHADALLDRMIAFLDDAVLEHPGLAARMLEVEIGGVDGRPDELAEHAVEVGRGEATRNEQALFGEGEQCHAIP